MAFRRQYQPRLKGIAEMCNCHPEIGYVCHTHRKHKTFELTLVKREVMAVRAASLEEAMAQAPFGWQVESVKDHGDIR